MKIQELWADENTQIMERYDLAMERIRLIAEDGTGQVSEPFDAYFLWGRSRSLQDGRCGKN